MTCSGYECFIDCELLEQKYSCRWLEEMSPSGRLLGHQPFVYLSSCLQRDKNFCPRYSAYSPSLTTFQESEEILLEGFGKVLIGDKWSIATCLQGCPQTLRPSCQWIYLKCWETFLFCFGKQWLLHWRPDDILSYHSRDMKRVFTSFFGSLVALVWTSLALSFWL